MGWGDSQQAELEASPQYQKLLKAFRLFDKNGDGCIDAAELRELLMRANPDADPTADNHFTEEDAQAIISSFDDNGDGVLSIEELVAAWAVIGGSDAKLNAAMKERRDEKQAALKRKQAKAAGRVVEGEAEFQNKFGDASKKDGGASAPSASVPSKAAASKPAAAVPDVSDAAAPTAAKERRPSAPKEPEPMNAMERARAAAAAKLGKDVSEGQGSLAAHKASSAAPEATELSAADRAKAKAKADLEAKEARKKAAKAAAKAAAE